MRAGPVSLADLESFASGIWSDPGIRFYDLPEPDWAPALQATLSLKFPITNVEDALKQASLTNGSIQIAGGFGANQTSSAKDAHAMISRDLPTHLAVNVLFNFVVPHGFNLAARLTRQGYRIVAQGGAQFIEKQIGNRWIRLAANEAQQLVTQTVQLHHPIPKFLGGYLDQPLYALASTTHREFHSVLVKELRTQGLPLRVGGPGGSSRDWARYLLLNAGAQEKAFSAVLDASRYIDKKHGTQLTRQLWLNILEGAFTRLEPAVP